MDTTSFRLPADLIADVERLAEERGVTKSELVREALAQYVGRSVTSLRKLDRVAALDAILEAIPSQPGDAATPRRGKVLAGFGESSLAPEQLHARGARGKSDAKRGHGTQAPRRSRTA